MQVLFDVGVPRPLAKYLSGHEVVEARALGWDRIVNGDLIKKAEEHAFDVFLTNDTKMRYQQNLSSRRIAVIVLLHSHWPMVKLTADRIAEAVNACMVGTYIEIDIPFRKTRLYRVK